MYNILEDYLKKLLSIEPIPLFLNFAYNVQLLTGLRCPLMLLINPFFCVF